MTGLLDSLPWHVAPMLALCAGVTALAPLGAQVLARGVVFIDLAVAQAAAAGALCGAILFEHPGPILIQASALVGALLCVGVVAGVIRRARATGEAMIGLLYVLGPVWRCWPRASIHMGTNIWRNCWPQIYCGPAGRRP